MGKIIGSARCGGSFSGSPSIVAHVPPLNLGVLRWQLATRMVTGPVDENPQLVIKKGGRWLLATNLND